MSRKYDSGESSLATSLTILAIALGAPAVIGEVVEAGYGSDDARTYLQQSGYANMQLTDTDTYMVGLAGCDQLDAVKHEFTATAPNGTDVQVMVCNGLFKDATIRQGGV